MGLDVSKLNKPIHYIIDTGDKFTEQEIKIPDAVLATLSMGGPDTATKLVKHHAAIQFYSEKIRVIIDILGKPEDIIKTDPELAVKKTQELNKLNNLLQEHVNALEILICTDDYEKGWKQLLFGTEKYKFIVFNGIATQLDNLHAILKNDILAKKSKYNNKSQELIVLDNIIRKIADDFENMIQEDTKIKTETGGATVCKKDFIEGNHSADAIITVNCMMDRDVALDVQDSPTSNYFLPNKINFAEKAKRSGEEAEFIIYILTRYPYFTTEHKKYLEEKKLGHPIYYIGYNKDLY